MFNQAAPTGNGGRSAAAASSSSGTGQPSLSGQSSALMTANAKLKRKQASPKTVSSGMNSMDGVTGQKTSSGAPSALKYAQGGMTSPPNFLDKYATKTRNKIVHTTSATQPGQIAGNSDSISSGNGGQPAIYPTSSNQRKLHTNGQNYKA